MDEVQVETPLLRSSPPVKKTKGLPILIIVIVGAVILVGVYLYAYLTKTLFFKPYTPTFPTGMYYLTDLDDPMMYTPSPADVEKFKKLVLDEKAALDADPAAWRDGIFKPASQVPGYGEGGQPQVNNDAFDSKLADIG